MIDILIVHPGKIRHGYITEHLGIASLKSFVQSRGLSADTLDLAVEGLSIRDGMERILSIQPTVLGVSLLNDTKFKGLELIRRLRQDGYSGVIVAGGYFASFAAQDLLRDIPEIDYIVRGEGEVTLVELLKKIIGQSRQPVKEIRGLSFREGGIIIHNPARPLITDLDILPAVDRKYSAMVLQRGSHLRIFASRGCWGRCNFCDIIGMYGQSPGKVWRYRSVKRVVDEIEQLVLNFKTNYFAFNDDQFLLPGNKGLARAEEFASELERRNLQIQFELMCRADTIYPPTMRRLRSVGLQRVFLGLESFDEKQLQRFKKRISVRQNLKAVITLYHLKIDVIASVILADAFTTLGDVVRQFIMLFELKRRYFNSRQCQISVNEKIEIYPGSFIYQEYKKLGLLTRDHYLLGYDYRLRFFTAIRLKLFQFEARLSRIILRPVATLRDVVRAIRWRAGQLIHYLEYQR